MKKVFENKYVVLFVRIVLGLFFIYAAQAKIFNTADFAGAIRAYDIIPPSLSYLPAIFLPWIELFCGIFLISGIYTQSSAWVAGVLLSIFTINILIALLRGLEIDCGCGASVTGIEKVSWYKIFENCFLIALLLFIVKKESFIFALSNKFTTK